MAPDCAAFLRLVMIRCPALSSTAHCMPRSSFHCSRLPRRKPCGLCPAGANSATARDGGTPKGCLPFSVVTRGSGLRGVFSPCNSTAATLFWGVSVRAFGMNAGQKPFLRRRLFLFLLKKRRKYAMIILHPFFLEFPFRTFHGQAVRRHIACAHLMTACALSFLRKKTHPRLPGPAHARRKVFARISKTRTVP